MSQLTESATWREIHAQPEIWRSWAKPLARQANEIRSWINDRAPQEIWLSGAGTSAFIGDILCAGDRRLRAVATTDLVAGPQDLLTDDHILAVQFGRSGNSSESVGMMDVLDASRPGWDRLHITCNPEGALATRPAPGPGEARVINLPEATHDAGFAMTSSFTTMLLSALACLSDFDASTQLPKMADQAETVLADVAALDIPRPERAVFLGSGALTGVARESALKVLELAAGRTVTQWDSCLGFRHGPKALVDDKTHVFVMLHPDTHTARYDRDMADEIRRQFPQIRVTTIGPDGDISIASTGDVRADGVLYVLPAQILSAQWSANLNLPVDDPFQGQNLSRVVSGVTLYPFAG
jgi:tagatose-6-phosphate ketose/aldose isomerase